MILGLLPGRSLSCYRTGAARAAGRGPQLRSSGYSSRFNLSQNRTEGGRKLFVADVALAELQPHVEGAILGLIIEHEGLRPRSSLSIVLAGFPSLITHKSALEDTADHLI